MVSMKKTICTVVCLLLFLGSWAQKKQPNKVHIDNFSKQWESVLSLIDGYKYRNAALILDSVYVAAKSKNDAISMFKAQLFYLKIIHDTSDNAKEDLMLTAEQYSKTEKFPFNALWQSISAEFFWDYYETNRLKILSRPSISREIIIEDIDYWDANRFFDKTASLYFYSNFDHSYCSGSSCY